MSETIRGNATSGTWVYSGKPSSPQYVSAKVWQYVGGASNAYQSFVHTSLPANLAGRQVISATLELEFGQNAGSRTVTVQRHTKPSKPYASLTYSNRPVALSGSTAVSVTQDALTKVWSFDVTADLQAIASGGAYYGWRVLSSYASKWGMYSWAGTRAPRLIVVLAETLEPPANLAPQGVVSLNDPTFTWLASDSLSAAQMQIDEVDGDFSTPLWDSGTVATTIAQMNPVALGWAGLADGDEVSVRVRHTTDAGVTDYCDPVDVTRTAKGVLAITNPSGTTQDPTPPVIHAFSGTQTSFQLLTLVNGVLVDDTGRLAGDDLSWTPTRGATAAGQSLTFTLRVWDDVDRVASSGDPVYAEDSVTVVYTPSEVIAGVTALSADRDGVRPWVDLSWTRGEAADEWLILRDGAIIARIDGTDEDGGVWSYRDWTCPPNTDVTYNVQPIIEGEAGADGPATTVRTEVSGAWVFDPGTGVHFSFSGNDPQLAYGENTVEHTPLGGASTFATTFALRGLEGTVAGDMRDFDGRTLAEQTADLWAIKSAPAGTYRFAIGDVNIPVRIFSLSAVFDPSSLTDDIVKSVSLTLRQNGELPFDPISL